MEILLYVFSYLFVFLCGATLPVFIRIYKENKALKSEPPAEDYPPVEYDINIPELWGCYQKKCDSVKSCEECSIYRHNNGKE